MTLRRRVAGFNIIELANRKTCSASNLDSLPSDFRGEFQTIWPNEEVKSGSFTENEAQSNQEASQLVHEGQKIPQSHM